jgi:hypothetical protein
MDFNVQIDLLFVNILISSGLEVLKILEFIT